MDADANSNEDIHVSAQRVMEAVDRNEACAIIDVRTPGEFERGRIQGSINIPVDRIPDVLPRTVADTATTIYVYCLSGSRSISATELLRSMGYGNAFDMKNGLLAWRAAAYPLTT